MFASKLSQFFLILASVNASVLNGQTPSTERQGDKIESIKRKTLSRELTSELKRAGEAQALDIFLDELGFVADKNSDAKRGWRGTVSHMGETESYTIVAKGYKSPKNTDLAALIQIKIENQRKYQFVLISRNKNLANMEEYSVKRVSGHDYQPVKMKSWGTCMKGEGDDIGKACGGGAVTCLAAGDLLGWFTCTVTSCGVAAGTSAIGCALNDSDPNSGTEVTSAGGTVKPGKLSIATRNR